VRGLGFVQRASLWPAYSFLVNGPVFLQPGRRILLRPNAAFVLRGQTGKNCVKKKRKSESVFQVPSKATFYGQTVLR